MGTGIGLRDIRKTEATAKITDGFAGCQPLVVDLIGLLQYCCITGVRIFTVYNGSAVCRNGNRPWGDCQVCRFKDQVVVGGTHLCFGRKNRNTSGMSSGAYRIKTVSTYQQHLEQSRIVAG